MQHGALAPLSVRGLTVAYDEKPVLWDVDFEIPQQGLVAVIGPSGAGKSTMIKGYAWAGDPDPSRRYPGFRQTRKTFARNASPTYRNVPASTEVFPPPPSSVAMGLYGKIGWCRPVRRRLHGSAREHLDRVLCG